MTYQNDPNGDPVSPRTVRDGEGMGWGIPMLIAAVVLIGGLFLFNSLSDRTTTTASTSAPNAQSTPSATVGKTNPPPAKTQ